MAPSSISLVVVPDPILDESPTSWLMRLGQMHRIWPSKLFTVLRIKKIEDFDRELRLSHFELITRGTNIAHEKLVCLSKKFEHIEDEALGKVFLLSSHPRTPRYRYCPRCLETDAVPYWRMTWRMTHYCLCPVHRNPLRSSCFVCGKWVRPVDTSHDFWQSESFFCVCTDCGADFRECPVRPINHSEGLDEALDLQRAVTAAVLRGYYFVHGVEEAFPLKTLPRAILLGGSASSQMHAPQLKMLPVFEQCLKGELPSYWGDFYAGLLMRRALRLRLGRLMGHDALF